jgi:hypothetical protein
MLVEGGGFTVWLLRYIDDPCPVTVYAAGHSLDHTALELFPVTIRGNISKREGVSTRFFKGNEDAPQ